MRVSVKRALLLALLLAAPFVAAEVTPTERHFDSDGVRIRYLTAGEGEPLVLIHGFTGNAATNWVLPGTMATLAERHRVIAIDVRGHGGSGKPHEPSAYGLEMARDVVRLLDHLEIERAHVAGYSMGGFIALNLVATAPGRIRSAVVGGAGQLRDDDPAFMNAIVESLESGNGILPLLQGLVPDAADPQVAARLAEMNRAIMAVNDAAALAAAMRAIPELAVAEDRLRENRVPILAIVGERDPLKPGVDALASAAANLELVVVDGADHISLLLEPRFRDSWAGGILRFLETRRER